MFNNAIHLQAIRSCRVRMPSSFTSPLRSFSFSSPSRKDLRVPSGHGINGLSVMSSLGYNIGNIELFRRNLHSSISVVDNVVTAHPSPRAIVLLFGWIGAEHRQLQKYAKVYQDRDCATISTVSPPFPTLLKHHKTLANVLDNVYCDVANLFQAIDAKERTRGKVDVPIILHVFSNGGAVLLEEMENHIRDTVDEDGDNTAHNFPDSASSKGMKPPPSAQIRTPRNELLQRIADCLQKGTIIYDSSPCYIHLSAVLQAAKHGIHNPILSWMVRGLCIALFSVGSVPSFMGSERMDNLIRTFWQRNELRNLTNRQAFIYSTADHITDADEVDKLVETRKQFAGNHVSVLKFSDSQHVKHMLKYPQDYVGLVEKELDAVASKI